MAHLQPNEEDIRLKNDKTWLGFFAKLIFFIASFVIVLIMILANMAGNNETLKEGIIQFTERTFNKPATLDRLVYMRFFPTLGVEIEGLHVQPFSGSFENVINVGKLKFYMSFLDVFFGTKKFKVLYLENAVVKEGVWGQRSISADNIAIHHDVAEKIAELKGKGKIGIYDWSFVFGMQSSGAASQYSYFFGDNIPFEIVVGDIKATGRLLLVEDNFTSVKDIVITHKDKKLSGELSLSLAGERTLRTKGNLKVNDAEGTLAFDMTLDRGEGGRLLIGGDIKGVSLTSEDFGNTEKSLPIFFGRINEVASMNNMPFQVKSLFDFVRAYDLDVKIDLQALHTEKSKENTLAFSLLKKADFAHLSDVKGSVDGISADVPDLYFIAQDDHLGLLMQGGKFNPALFGFVSNSLPSEIVNEKNVMEITCAHGVFDGKDSERTLSGFTAENTAGKKIYGKESKDFILEDTVYKTISDSLKSSNADGSCLSHISSKNPAPPAVPAEKPKDPVPQKQE